MFQYARHPESRKSGYPCYSVADPVEGRALVFKPKSQTLLGLSRSEREKLYRRCSGFSVYKNTVKVHRHAKSFPPKEILGGRKEIVGLSDNARRNLKFKIQNSSVDFISQFCLTFHEEWPTDGKQLKRMLNSWLTVVRKNVIDVKYMWVLEFQRRDAPHFHVFFNYPISDSLRYFLALAWCRITQATEIATSVIKSKKVKYRTELDLTVQEIEETSQFKFHDHEENFIAWDMGTGNYLTKYLDKEEQKNVPENFLNVGRFWGSSRNLVERPVFIESDALDQYLCGERTAIVDQIVRVLGKWHENKMLKGGYQYKSIVRSSGKSVNVHLVSDLFKQMLKYYRNPPTVAPVHFKINKRVNDKREEYRRILNAGVPF